MVMLPSAPMTSIVLPIKSLYRGSFGFAASAVSRNFVSGRTVATINYRTSCNRVDLCVPRVKLPSLQTWFHTWTEVHDVVISIHQSIFDHFFKGGVDGLQHDRLT